jgi:hypothetical protein
MNDIRQERIDALILHLCQNEISLKSGNTIRFKNSIPHNQNDGDFFIDGSKKGRYIIHFVDKLSLSLTSQDDFKFADSNNEPINTISLEGVDIGAILDLIPHLAIK